MAQAQDTTDLQNVLETEQRLVNDIQILNGTDTLPNRLNAVLKDIGEYFQADRTYIFELDEGGATMSNTYEWCAEGVTPQKDTLQKGDIHYIDRWLSWFTKHQTVLISDINSIKESNPNEYEIMARQDIHSYVEAPILADNKFSGFVGVDNPCEDKIKNSGELLLSLAYSLSNAMVRAANVEALELQFHQSLQALLAANPESLCTFQINLTRNTCSEGHGISAYIMKTLQSNTVDELFERVSKIIPNEEQKKQFFFCF